MSNLPSRNVCPSVFTSDGTPQGSLDGRIGAVNFSAKAQCPWPQKKGLGVAPLLLSNAISLAHKKGGGRNAAEDMERQ